MNDSNLMEMIDHQRWLMNIGVLNDAAKNNLYLYGSIVHKDVEAVEMDVDAENKSVFYIIYINNDLKKLLELYSNLTETDGELDIQKFKSYFKTPDELANFVRNYCGTGWPTELCNTLSELNGRFGAWRYNRLVKQQAGMISKAIFARLKSQGGLNFKAILQNFVKDYCGAKWSVRLEIKDMSEYKEGYAESEQQAEENTGPYLYVDRK